MKKLAQNAFTLVELLIVIGIIGILAVTMMVSLNPVEAQRKARDASRLKAAQTIQAVVEQALGDGLVFCASACNSAGTATEYNCGSNFLGVNICTYARSIQGDPLQGRTSTCMQGSGTQDTNCNMRYVVKTLGLDYEINVRQESASNANKLAGDGGNNAWMVEIFTGNNPNILSGTKDPT